MFKYSAQNTSSSLSLLHRKDQKQRECLEKDGRESNTNACRHPKSTKFQEVGLEKQAAQGDPSSVAFHLPFRLRPLQMAMAAPPSSSGNPAQGQCSEWC